MQSIGKISTSLASIFSCPVGEVRLIKRILITNTTDGDALLTLVVASQDGQGPKANLCPPAILLNAAIAAIDILNYGQTMQIENGTIIQAQSDTENQLEYLIEYDTV